MSGAARTREWRRRKKTEGWVEFKCWIPGAMLEDAQKFCLELRGETPRQSTSAIRVGRRRPEVVRPGAAGSLPAPSTLINATRRRLFGASAVDEGSEDA